MYSLGTYDGLSPGRKHAPALHALLRGFDLDEVLHGADHAAYCRGIVVNGNVIWATESERLDRALLNFQRVIDGPRLCYENFLSCCHI